MGNVKKQLSFRKWFPHMKVQTIFLILAVVMTVLMAFIIIYASFLIVSRVNVAVNVEQIPSTAVEFDIAGFEKLNLTR